MNTKEVAYEIIKEHLGTQTAKLYQKFYENKDDKTIKSSVNQLISEVLGEDNAAVIVQPLYLKKP